MISFNPSSLSSQFANFFGFPPSNSAGQATQVSLRTQNQTGISIVTGEGDRVTLSSTTDFQGVGAQFDYRGILRGQPISLRANVLESQFSNTLGISIEGDLNEQEIRDIQHVVQQTGGLTSDLSRGDVASILNRGQQIASANSLASVGIHIEQSEALLIQQGRPSGNGPSGAELIGRPESPAPPDVTSIQSPDEPPTDGSTLRGFLENILMPFEARSSEEQDRQQELSEDKVGNFLERIGAKLENKVDRLKNFLARVKETINEKAEKIANLALKFKDRVEQQAEKIAKVLGKLQDLADRGITSGEKVDRLNEKLANRSDRLADTVSRFTSKINEKVEKLDNYINNTTGRILNKADRLNAFADRVREKIDDRLDGESHPDAEALLGRLDEITGEGGFTDRLARLYGQATTNQTEHAPEAQKGNGEGVISQASSANQEVEKLAVLA